MNDKQGYNVTAVYDSWPAWKKEVTLTKYSSGNIGNKMNLENLELETTSYPTTFEKHYTELNKHNFLEVISMDDGNFIISTGDVIDDEPIDASLNDLIEIRDMLNKIIQSNTEKGKENEYTQIQEP